MAFSQVKSTIPPGRRTGSGGLSGGSTFQQGNRIGGGGLSGGSTFNQGNRVGGGGLSGGSTFNQGNRVGSGGLSGGSTFTQGQRVGSGGLGGGSTFTQGQRVGSGGLSGGSTFAVGNRVGSGGLSGGSTFNQGQRVGSTGLSRTGSSLGGSRSGSSIPRGNRTGGSGLSRSSGGGGGGGGGGLSSGGGGGLSRGGGGSTSKKGRKSRSISEQENFFHIRCGAPVSGSLRLNVIQTHDADGRLLPAEKKHWNVVTDGTVWTPEDWQQATPARSTGTQDAIGSWYDADDTSPTTSKVTIEGGEISDGCFVNFDMPSTNGMLLASSSVTLGSTGGMSTVHDIQPTVDAATVFVGRHTLSF